MANWNGTGIRWTDETLNDIHGCSKTSEGCQNCYAERVSHRFEHTTEPWTIQHVGENIHLKDGKRNELEDLPGPRWVFVNSMSDMFHAYVPDKFVHRTLATIANQHRSAFQILTKHGADQDRDLMPMPRNVMLGVSVESERRQYRIDWLRDQDSQTKFVSFEPLVERVPAPDLSGIDWAIIGGESGPDSVRREMDSDWARELIFDCWEQDVAVFFKQHSGQHPESNITLDMEDGRGPRRIEEFPELPDGVVSAPQEFLAVADGGFRLGDDK